MPTARIQDVDLYYESTGQGAPIVFIPGLGTGGQIWDQIVLRLAKNYQCITLDTRGAGRSGVSDGPYTISILAQDVSLLMRYLRLRNPTVAGHSMGGFIALRLSLGIPLHRVVLISTAASGLSDNGGLTPNSAKTLAMITSRQEVVQRIADVGLGSNAPPSIRKRLISTLLARPLRGRGYLAQQAAVAAFDMTQALRQIQTDTCIIHGTQDAMIPLESGETLAKNIPNSYLVRIEGCGHFPLIEHPEMVATIIDNHIRKSVSA